MSHEDTTEAASGDGPDLAGEISAPLPDADQLDAALDGSEGEGTEAGHAVVGEEAADLAGHAATDRTRVLEFTLAGEPYALNIDYIEEIVGDEPVTRVPNTPDYVEGVVDLRGQITTIVDPKVLLDKPDPAAGDLIVVFDSGAVEDGENLGWAVDDVRRVAPVADEEIDDAPVEEGHVEGIIDRGDDEEFVVWITPDLVFEADGE